MVRSVDPELDPVSHYNLALEHWAHFQQTWERGELDKSIFHSRVTVELCPERHPYRDTALNDLGGYLYTRFEQYGRMEDLEEAVERHRAALELRPHGHPDRSSSLSNLGLSLHTRFRRRGRTVDLDEAVEHHRAALEICCDGHPNRAMTLNNLAISLHTRFRQHGQTKDLDEVIDYHRAVLELRPNGHPNRSKSLNNLAAALHTRFDLHGRIADLDEAVKYHRAALKHIPEGHPDRSTSLHNLANCLHIRFQQHGQSADLFEAIKHHRAALELRPDSHPNRSSSLYNLADTLHTLFTWHGQAADLDEAIERHRAALELRPNGHPNRSDSLNSLAISAITRFEQYGLSADLDEAIEQHHAALELCPVGHPNRSTSLNNLAGCLATRFEQHGQSADLDEAIKHHRAALELRPNGHPNRSSSLNNLAGCLLGRATDLDEAISYQFAASELIPNSHPNHPMTLHNLACSLQARFAQNGQTADLINAIKYHLTALKLVPNGHPNCSTALHDLAVSLQTRFEQNGRTADLDDAIKHHHAALELRPKGHPQRSTSLASLGLSLYSRFKKFGVTDDFEECMQLLEDATEHELSSSTERLRVATLWAELAQKHSHHTISRAYKEAMLLLQRILIVSPTLDAHHNLLSQKQYHGTLPCNAAAYAVEGNRLEEAIEILEQGRGLLWAQMRGLRTPLDRLAEADKELADRFREVSRQLESLTTSPTELQDGSGTRRLTTEQEQIINEIRLLPEFEKFLEATPFKVLQQAASEGPVIVVNHSIYRCDVLIVLPREDLTVVCVPLDEEFYADSTRLYCELVGTRLSSKVDSVEYDDTLRRVMKTLWDRVVSKVVDKLNELEIAEGSRIWWCLTTLLSALPFHAAGPFEGINGTSTYLLDRYISSYAPTLGALIDAQSSCGSRKAPTALVIGDTSLPSAREEIRKIKNCGINPKLLSSKASHDTVTTALRKTSWVHFVCHGGLSSKPLNSSFKVSDRGLTLLDIVQTNLPNAQFAFLSACHTAEQSYNVAHDEVLHLAAAMQFSGFRSVIGSMWELLDVDGPFFAKTVYEYMCDCDEGELRYKRAAAGLRKAAIELKARDDVRVERWVNLIHIGA
ncbi:TPR-like protein [Fomitiporia mediterranea MF3/22]|uniref:TPR-like protein n=1 Tax=Fomitiporia mediterranea (strain MF3/22) TaxID=694068 RepID=R7SFY3_FOMME|nr:TPR-like protein [Fomitiporia mediterranea MF3/22]EJC97626.1 TPR-like protein [Fomitiporia mediterranea MF3/22]